MTRLVIRVGTDYIRIVSLPTGFLGPGVVSASVPALFTGPGRFVIVDLGPIAGTLGACANLG